MERYRRTIEIDVEVEGKTLRSTSKLIDEYHDMTLAFTVDLDSHTVVACEGSMSKNPYRVCPGAIAALQRAVGLSVGPGVKKAYRKAVLRHEGCAHMTELADNTFDFLMQKIWWDGVGISIENREQHEARLWPVLNQHDTCWAFNQERKFTPKVTDFLPGTPKNGTDR